MEKANTLHSEIDKWVKAHRVLLFMKGNKLMPVCGFSARVVDILNQLGCSYHTINILESEELRAAVKEYSDWPTYPQLYIKGEFIGGCDIIEQLFATGDLEKLLHE